MVLQAHIDGSQKDGNVLVLGGYLARADRWAEFSDRWQEILDWSPKWHKLRSKGAKRKLALDPAFATRYRALYEVILQHVHASICVAVPIGALNRVCDEYGLPETQRNPYFIAFNSLIALYVGHVAKVGIKESVELIFDDQSEKKHVFLAWDEYYSSMPRRFKKLIEGTPVFKEDSKVLPLQAADLFVSWKREQFEKDGSIVSKLEPLMPWESQGADHAHIYGQLDEPEMIRVLTQTVATRFRMGASFSYSPPGLLWGE